MSFFLYIIAAAWQDGKQKAVSGWFLLFFFVHFIVSQICHRIFWANMDVQQASFWFRGMSANSSLGNLWAGCLIGAALFLISRITEGALGQGDGLFFLIAGIYLGFWKNLFLLVSTLFLCSIAGLIYMVLGRLNGKDYRKKTLPLLIFTVPAGILLACI